MIAAVAAGNNLGFFDEILSLEISPPCEGLLILVGFRGEEHVSLGSRSAFLNAGC